jgi:hypothetical protein
MPPRQLAANRGPPVNLLARIAKVMAYCGVANTVARTRFIRLFAATHTLRGDMRFAVVGRCMFYLLRDEMNIQPNTLVSPQLQHDIAHWEGLLSFEALPPN